MTLMALTRTSASVQTALALLQRATFLMDDGDELAGDQLLSSRIAHLALAGWMVTPEPVAPDLADPEVQACVTVRDCIDRAAAHAATWDLTDLTVDAAQFMIDLHDLAQAMAIK